MGFDSRKWGKNNFLLTSQKGIFYLFRVRALVDGTCFRKELSELHGFAESASNREPGFGIDKGVAVIAQVRSDNGFDGTFWGLAH